MSDRLLIELDWEPGTLQRLIGLIERRGFEVVAFELAACGGARQVVAEVQARHQPKDFSVLVRQIDRLHGIFRLEDGAENRSFSIRHQFPLVG